MTFLLGKNQKTFKVRKIRKYEGGVFLKKKVLTSLKAFFSKMGRRKICRWEPAELLLLKIIRVSN